MTLPTPDDPADAPVWENYIVAQTAQASLGLIPPHARAVGVSVAGTTVLLRFQLTELTEADETDMDDIVSELEALVGDHVQVGKTVEICSERHVSPYGTVRYVFLARDPQ